MIRHLLLLALAIALLTSHVRADVADIAELFPAGTLAYAEIRNPADVAKVVSGWVKGTPLEQGMNLVQDRKDEVKDVGGAAGQIPVGIATLLSSPEFLQEIGRFGGAAVGLTGFTEKSEPQVVAVVLFGNSTAGGLLARGLLTTSRDLRRVDTVDGIPILQHRAFPPQAFGNDGKPLPFENSKPTEGAFEATYAYRPGMLVVGTHKAGVAETIRRFSRKHPGPPLAEEPAFKRFAEERKQAGLFFYSVPQGLAKELNAARKANRAVIDDDTLALLNFVAKPESCSAFVGTVAVGSDDITVTLKIEEAPGQPSPLHAILAGTDSSRFLTSAPKDAACAIAVALPPAAHRANAVLAFWDACEKARGELGPLASQRIAEAEKSAALDVRGGVFRRVGAITVVLPERQELPVAVAPLPLFVCHTDSNSDADALAQSIPRLFQLATKAAALPQPTSETIQGHRILSLPASSTAGFPAIHYASSGSLLVLGLDRKWVARLALGDWKTVADRTVGTPPTGVISGIFRPGQLARFAAATHAGKQRVPLAVEANNPSRAGSLADVLDALPPVSLEVIREKSSLSARLSLKGFRTSTPTLAKKLVAWLERLGTEAASSDGDSIPRLPFDR